MKTVCKKLLSLMLVAMLLVSAVPFQVFATEGDVADPTETTAAAAETNAAAEPAVAAAVVEVPETTAAATEAAVVVPETTAATEAPAVTEATEAPATNQNTSSQPAVNTIGDLVTVQYVVPYEDGTAVVKEYANRKVGTVFPAVPSESAVLTTYAKYAGSSAGWKVHHWELNGEYFTASSTYIKDAYMEGDTIEVVAVLAPAEQKISLNANNGKVSPNYVMAIVGEAYPELPVPTRTHYDFAGWYWTNSNGEEVRVDVDPAPTVYNTNTLKAKWTLANYAVTYQRYTLGEGWVDAEFVVGDIPANTTVSTAAGTFPTDAQIKSYFALDGFKIIGWEILDTDTAFKAGSTKISYNNFVIRPRYEGTVTLKAVNPTDYKDYSTKTMTVEIGEPVGKMSNPGDRNGFAFTGWTTSEDLGFQMISTKANLSNTSEHLIYYPDVLGTTFFASYLESVTVYLYIHTNNNYKNHDAVVRYYVPANNEFDTSTINMYSIYSKYGNFDDSDDTVSLWYTLDEWKNLAAGVDNSPAQTYYFGENGPYELHIMLTNGGSASSNTSSGNNYNNNASTADPSNPTTGDQIFMAITVMAVSASALVLFFFLKKRKAC